MSRQRIGEYTTVYTIGSLGYSALEVLWRGFTHWTMSVTGGVCFLLLYRMNRSLRRRPLLYRCAAGAGIITGVEFSVGCVVNRLLGWDVWDYSDMPFQIMGQVCLLFSVLWFLLCIPGLTLATALQKRLYAQ